MAWCLIKSEATKFKKALKDGTIDPLKLSEMTSEERRSFFQEFTNESNAIKMNALFESKLLLKNQQRGMITWAKRVAGITPQAKRDILSKINRLDKVLDPQENEQFLRDLASTRLGVGVSEAEAKTLHDLGKEIERKKANADEDGNFKSEETRLSYGASVVALENYVRDLKLEARKVNFKEQPLEFIKQKYLEVPGTLKSLVASLDNSFFGRQGIKTLADTRTSKIWFKNFLKSWKDIATELKGGDAIDAIKADIYSRPNAINGKYKAGGYGLNVLSEEAFPSSLPERIPLFGRLFKASESAYNGGALRLRADLADRLITKAEEHGVNTLLKEEAEPLGHLVGSLTGRGSIGRLGVFSKEINVLFFSVKFVKSNFDTLTAHAFDKKVRQNEFARKEAIKSTLSIVSTMAMVLAIAKMLNPDWVEEDPRSTNFGKIKIFGRWTDITGGMASLPTLVARILPTQRDGEWGRWYKSSSGNWIKLGDSYGSMTPEDVFYNFFEGKLSPFARVIKTYTLDQGKDFIGKPVTLTDTLVNTTFPISVQSYMEMMKDDEATAIDVLGSLILDGLGLSVSTYLPNQFDWEGSTSKKLNQFKEEVGEKEFKKANENFNKQYTDWLEVVIRSDEYKGLSEEAQKEVRSKGKEEIQQRVFDEYGFKYKTKKKTPEEKDEDNTIKNLIDDTISYLNDFSLVKQAYASEKTPEELLAFAGTPRQEEIYEEMKQDYREGEASYYDALDPNQTRPDTDGTGAYGRKVEPGSVAFGNRVFHDALKKGEEVYIQVKGIDKETPYGKGVFRIDDTMNKRYNKKGQFNIDFHPEDLTDEQRNSGRFKIEWKIVEPGKRQITPKSIKGILKQIEYDKQGKRYFA